jgi:hypothetical protein
MSLNVSPANGRRKPVSPLQRTMHSPRTARGRYSIINAQTTDSKWLSRIMVQTGANRRVFLPWSGPFLVLEIQVMELEGSKRVSEGLGQTRGGAFGLLEFVVAGVSFRD